jgi:hypothetical protein
VEERKWRTSGQFGTLKFEMLFRHLSGEVKYTEGSLSVEFRTEFGLGISLRIIRIAIVLKTT